MFRQTVDNFLLSGDWNIYLEYYDFISYEKSDSSIIKNIFYKLRFLILK